MKVGDLIKTNKLMNEQYNFICLILCSNYESTTYAQALCVKYNTIWYLRTNWCDLL